MARYIARAQKYGHGIGEAEYDVAGREIKKKRVANFQHGVLLDHEVEAGLKAFTFKGLADGVPPETRLSVFDTRDYQKANKLTDDERLAIEEILDNSPANGPDFFKVDEIHAEKPFPSYDEKEPEEILEIVELAGVDPDVAYRYEAENLARPELLEAFAAIGATDAGVPQELESLKLPEGEEIFKPSGERINVPTVRA